MARTEYITQEGFERFKKELDQLTSIERQLISQQIAEARDKGDLSENAEYHAAKEAQGMLEMKINKLENTLANSRVIDYSKIDTTTVQLLNRVKIRNTSNNAVMEFSIFPETEADLKASKMSVNSPIAQGLLGKKVGDVVNVRVPNGLMDFEILKISL